MKRRHQPPPLKPIERDYRISLCTTCMGRLHDLALTLPRNLELNADYPHVEFVILDYNSRDGLGDWVRREMSEHLRTGRVAYYRTEEPQYYSMTHSRNVAFKLATGHVVCSVDADNYTLDPTPAETIDSVEGFAAYVNRLANQQSERAFFAKGRRLLRGRLGFFRQEFLDVLGGYDENLQGYGHDDHDLYQRALGLGFTPYFFGGTYVSRIKTPRAHKGANMQEKNWRVTESANKARSAESLAQGQFRANVGREWGRARVQKNFSEWIEL